MSNNCEDEKNCRELEIYTISSGFTMIIRKDNHNEN